MPHAFSVIGYKENKEKNELLIEILNPYHSGAYILNNIKKNEEYNKLKIGSKNKKLFDEAKKGTIINEEEFDEPELKESFNNYGNNGYLIMKFDTFYNWIWEIEFCDPMIGAHEYIIELFPKEKKNIFLRIDSKTKIKAYLINKEKKLNDDEQIIEFNKEKFGYNNKYNLLLKNINYNEKYENNEGNNALIY